MTRAVWPSLSAVLGSARVRVRRSLGAGCSLVLWLVLASVGASDPVLAEAAPAAAPAAASSTDTAPAVAKPFEPKWPAPAAPALGSGAPADGALPSSGPALPSSGTVAHPGADASSNAPLPSPAGTSDAAHGSPGLPVGPVPSPEPMPAPALAPVAPAAPAVAAPATPSPAPAATPSGTPQGTAAQASGTAQEGARPRSLLPLVQPLWSELTPEQRSVLSPLESQWNTLTKEEKRPWLSLAARLPGMPPKARAQAEKRIREWAALTPEQRRLARNNYRLAKKLPKEERVATWEQYQQMTPEQQEVLRRAGWTSNTAARHAGAPTGLAKEAAQPLWRRILNWIWKPEEPAMEAKARPDAKPATEAGAAR